MRLFHRLIWAALAVALAVGTLQTALHQLWAVPLLLEAERFEDQKAVAAPPAAHAHNEEHAHVHDEDAWAPADGAERTFWTWVANVLHGFGLALLALVALTAWVWRRGSGPASPERTTPVWLLAMGVAAAGFLSLHLWPSLGLHAEIPGMDAAELGARQRWWLLSAVSAGAACACLAFARGHWRWAVAAALLALPFAVGAPQLQADPLAGFAPEAQAVLRPLGQQFVVVTHGVAVGLWMSLGLACAWAFARWVNPLVTAPHHEGATHGA
ncbi:CbtA family protein [Hydrogenophaga pseudoflava]|uniref:CbtA family protein n=1 Tax=Hydrogenophaga pseudoflava TaxID=47421 RepID=UPI0027E52A5D|nr:CbtA family protein [Hydrogenophaga pseudoflava]MDQ7746629.1 CbtA family protein [Hydrogenophaga pseudoflava]